jgi:hypothetical protein
MTIATLSSSCQTATFSLCYLSAISNALALSLFFYYYFFSSLLDGRRE